MSDLQPPASDLAERERRRIEAYFDRRGSSWARWRKGRFALEAERRLLLRACARRLAKPLSGLKICDVGCGDGADLEAWHVSGIPQSQLAGTELLSDRARAASTALPAADIRHVTDFRLPFADGAFDVTSASLVLSTVLAPDLRRELFAEMRRVTSHGGLVLVYDFKVRKPTNRSVVAMTRRVATDLGSPPSFTRRAAPFLPLLDGLLHLPAPVQTLLRPLLPRTHVLYGWVIDR